MNTINKNPAHKKNPCRRRNKSRSAGMSLVEILIALAIAALLLTATAAAFDAALNSYQANHEIAMVGMSARNCLYQMTTTLRSAWNDPDVATITVNGDGTQCSLVDANGRDIIYRYDGITNELKVNINGSGNWYVLVENVHPAAGKPIFTATSADNPDFPAGTIGKVEICFDIVGNQAVQNITAAAVPRNIVYMKSD